MSCDQKTIARARGPTQLAANTRFANEFENERDVDNRALRFNFGGNIASFCVQRQRFGGALDNGRIAGGDVDDRRTERADNGGASDRCTTDR